MIKKNKLILTTLIAMIGTIIGGLSASLMWFAKMNALNLNIGGSVLSQYFDSGEGTQEDPFIITRPKHWENLVWLHNNVSTFYQAINNGSEGDENNEKGYYFQVGKLNPDLDDGILYVYDYDDNGMISSTNNTLSSRTLNLRGSEKMIPIGSCTKPFMGEVVSDGITISGFDVLGFEDRNNNLVQDVGEKGFNDIGIFGYVGRNSYISDLYFEDFKIHLANAEADRANGENVVHNSSYHDSNKDSNLDTVYAGYIAGHIHYSTTLQRVYINNCSITGGSAAVSGFGYFGVVENEDGNLKPTPLETISETKTAGDGNSFGGSLDMYSVFDRLSEIARNVRNITSQYVTSEIIVKDSLTDNSFIHSQVKSNVGTYTHSSGNTNFYYYDSVEGGSFNITVDNSYIKGNSQGTGNIYECLYGESIKYTKTVTTYTLIDEWYDCFLIQRGSNYLNKRHYSDIQNVTDEGQAAGWNFDGSNHLYSKVLDQIMYLNRDNFALTMSTTANPVWNQNGDGEIYTIVNGENYYLDFDTTWHLSPGRDRYLITDNSGHYLGGSLSGVTNITSEDSATQWIIENPNGETSLGYFDAEDNTIHYLTNTNDSLGFSTTKKTWSKEGSYYYTTLQGIKHYIVFENGEWCLRPENGVRISDGSNHYLTGTDSAIGNANNLNGGTIWHYSSNTGDTQIFHIYNGNKYYLSVNNSKLNISTNTATWHRNGNSLYYTVNDVDYYLIYQNGWTAIPLEYRTIHDASGTNYLVANGTNTFTNTTTAANATHFYFSNDTGENPTGTINYYYNGNIYYLNVNSSTATNGVLNSGTGNTNTSWSNDGNSVYFTNGNYVYYLEYDNGWKLRTYVNGRHITDGTNYLVLNGTTISNTTNPNNATVFLFGTMGTNPSGYINVPGTNYYLRNNNGNLVVYNGTSTNTTYRTNWSNDGSNFYTGSNYLVCREGSWFLTNSVSLSGYYISYNGYYMNLNGTTIETSTTPKTIWQGNPLSSSPTNGDISAAGTNYHLYIENNTNLTVNTSDRTWYNSDGKLYYRAGLFIQYSYYVGFSNNAFTAGRSSNNPPQSEAVSLTFTYDSYDLTGTSKVVPATNNIVRTVTTKVQIPNPSITSTNYNVTKNLTTSGPISKSYSVSLFNTSLQNMEKAIESNVKSGNPTYFPLRVDQDEAGNYAANYAASNKNTGYIISGANVEETLSDTYQMAHGDIRIGGWPISNINGSYANSAFTTVYTIDDSNSMRARALTTAEKEEANYTHALEEFGKTLNGASKVFGLHFMDAAISTDHTLRAKQATILGQTYQNYELPEDSIDFNVYQRGQISFFAGEYFTNNNAFFSFHRIFRDANNDISDIKEILEIYEHAQRHDKANYIYKFSDGTYTNSNGTYTESRTLEGQYSSTPVFKTEWITNPSGLSTNSHRLYYFSLPCNSGEYALGSVSGKTGAYLCYLDIAANGGDSILENIKNTDTASTFPVDFRSASDTSNHSILQLGAEIPEAVDPNSLSISVTFDNSEETCAGTAYSDGVYIIRVNNTSGVTMELSVLVIDDDDDLYNDYNYGYIVYYTNNDYTDTIIQGQAFNDDETALITVDYWKRLAIFVIPSSGEAGESSYE